METYEVLILCLFNLLSFIVGAKVGQNSRNTKEITINPVKAIKRGIRDSVEEKKNILKQKQIDTMLDNIDKYNGSGLGQTEIPRD